MKIKIYYSIIIIGMLTVVGFFLLNIESNQSFYQNAINIVESEHYEGLVVNKFIDSTDGGRRKIILQSGKEKVVLDLIYEKKGVL